MLVDRRVTVDDARPELKWVRRLPSQAKRPVNKNQSFTDESKTKIVGMLERSSREGRKKDFGKVCGGRYKGNKGQPGSPEKQRNQELRMEISEFIKHVSVEESNLTEASKTTADRPLAGALGALYSNIYRVVSFTTVSVNRICVHVLRC